MTWPISPRPSAYSGPDSTAEMVDYSKTHAFWEGRGRDPSLDALNVTMLRERLPDLAAFIDRAEKRRLRRLLRLDRSMDVLDLGCGAGRLSIEFARRCRSVVAVDFSQALVDRGRVAAREAGVSNIRWIVASAVDFQSADTFDAIFMGGLLPFLDDADVLRLLNRLRAMLRPKGTLASRDSVLADREPQPPATPPGYEVKYRRRADYAAFFCETGFEIVLSDDLYAFPAPAYLYDRLVPERLKAAAVPRALLRAALMMQLLFDHLQRRLAFVNRALAGRRAKIVQIITVCRHRLGG